MGFFGGGLRGRPAPEGLSFQFALATSIFVYVACCLLPCFGAPHGGGNGMRPCPPVSCACAFRFLSTLRHVQSVASFQSVPFPTFQSGVASSRGKPQSSPNWRTDIHPLPGCPPKAAPCRPAATECHQCTLSPPQRTLLLCRRHPHLLHHSAGHAAGVRPP